MKEVIIIFLVAMCVTSLFNGLNLNFNSPSDQAPISPQASTVQPGDDQTAPAIGQPSQWTGSKSGPQPNGSQM